MRGTPETSHETLFHLFCHCCAHLLSRVWLFVDPWTVTHQASLSIGFPRQEYWTGLPFPFSRGSFWPRDQTHVFCNSCIAGGFFTIVPPGYFSQCLIWSFKIFQPEIDLIYRIGCKNLRMAGEATEGRWCCLEIRKLLPTPHQKNTGDSEKTSTPYSETAEILELSQQKFIIATINMLTTLVGKVQHTSLGG